MEERKTKEKNTFVDWMLGVTKRGGGRSRSDGARRKKKVARGGRGKGRGRRKVARGGKVRRRKRECGR